MRAFIVPLLLAALAVLATSYPIAAQATRETLFDIRVPIDQTTPSACSPQSELVHFTGETSYQVVLTQGPGGPSIVRTQGRTNIRGRGLTSGLAYHTLQVEQGILTFSADRQANHYVNTFWVRTPVGQQYLARETLHFVLNATGTITVANHELIFENTCF
jgi:hypothetical protein